MKHILSTFLLLLLNINLILCQEEKKTPQKDPLYIPNNIINMGSVKSDTIINQIFTIENISDKKVNILSIEKSCQCTNIGLSEDKYLIEPGEKVNITLKINLQDKKGEFGVWGLIIADTKQKFYKLIVKGTIKN